ncbi:MAG: DsrE family protein [Kangiellaceae bacterium]
MSNTQHTNKFLINAQYGKDDVEKATISFILAASASKESEAVVFVTAAATYLCAKGGANGVVYEGAEPIKDLMDQFVSNGGRIWVCPICAKLKGITADDLIEGAEIAGAPKSMAFLANGGKVLA